MKESKPKPQTEKPTTQPEGTERHRDEQRSEGGPRYGGEAWKVADERGDQRFGHARNDDADPSELPREQAETDEGELVHDTDSAIESSGQHAGMGRGEKPRKSKEREK